MDKSPSGGKPVARTGMLIRKPVAEVFAAFIDPRITTRFWFTKSSGPLVAGTPVTWEWEMYEASTRVVPKFSTRTTHRHRVGRLHRTYERGMGLCAHGAGRYLRQHRGIRLDRNQRGTAGTCDQRHAGIHLDAGGPQGMARTRRGTEPDRGSFSQRSRGSPIPPTSPRMVAPLSAEIFVTPTPAAPAPAARSRRSVRVPGM